MPAQKELTSYLDSLFADYDCTADYSRNGLQVECHGEVRKAAFSVDARQVVFDEAARIHADYLFCHHGLFWGDGMTSLRGIDADRIRTLLKNDISLYAMHLPLDAHESAGNNAQLAELLGIASGDRRPFALNRGIPGGVIADSAAGFDVDRIARTLEEELGASCAIYHANGRRIFNRIAIVTGSGGGLLQEAAASGAELLVTGELGHSRSITAQELNVAVVTAGHYATETLGPKAVMKRVQETFPDIECAWIDAPTSL